MLDSSVRVLKGVGPAREKLLAKLGILTLEDLLMHAPRTYADRRTVTPAASAAPGRDVTVIGSIASSGFIPSRRGRSRFQAVLRDESGSILMTFFHARYLSRRLVPGTRLMASGRVELFGTATMVHPELVFLKNGKVPAPEVLPVYPLTSGLNQSSLRALVRRGLEHLKDGIPDILPGDEMLSMGFEGRLQALTSLHFPSSPKRGMQARRMLALEELVLHQIRLRRIRSKAAKSPGIPIKPPAGTLEKFIETLPFQPTRDQTRVLDAMEKDMASSSPMRRLLQGDVGSGKTLAAAGACALCCAAGFAAVLAAPTEVLAAQHQRTMSRLLAPLGIRCRLLTGGSGSGHRRALEQDLQAGKVDLLIGTHAVLEDRVDVPRLGLFIADEQHKFGVRQRESILRGRDPMPHYLLMTATPIPRTLAMTLYGDLDISVIRTMPPGRGRTFTRIMDRSERGRVLEFLLKRLQAGERAYIVYPLREASEELDLRDASSSFEILRDGPLGSFGVGLLTGAMTGDEKLKVTHRFVSGEISVLVSTTVVEVGLDVPQATVMIIAHAHRFGLSQLHQLRGRIGRGGKDSWCFLMKDDDAGENGLRRLAVMAGTDDGFQVAREDLRLRGPGDVAGTRQHGVPSFRIASLLEDADLFDRAAAIAAEANV